MALIKAAMITRCFGPGKQPSLECILTGLRRQISTGTSYSLVKQFNPEEVRQFLASTGDANPIHSQAQAAQKAGFPGPILPGILLASLFPAIIGTHFPGAVYASQSLKFRKPALVGQAVEAVVTASQVSGSRVSFDTKCYAADDQGRAVLLVEGQALALLKQGQGAAPAS